MMKGKCILGLVLLTTALLGSCSSYESPGDVEQGAMQEFDARDTNPLIRRVRALESEISAVAESKVWSGKFIGPHSRVRRAWLDGTTLLFETWNADLREFEIHAIDTASGEQRWILTIGANPLARAPHVGLGSIAFLTDRDGGMIVVNARTGGRVHHIRTRLGVIPSSDATSTSDSVFMGSEISGRMVSVAASDGRKGWDFLTTGACRSTPLLTYGMPRELLVYGTDQGEIVALAAKEYHEVPPKGTEWLIATGGPISGDPDFGLIGDGEKKAGLVVVPSEDGWLYGVDPSVGRNHWVLRTNAAFKRKPAIIGNRVFARNAERLFCLDASTGERAWWAPSAAAADDYARSELFGPPEGFENAHRALASREDRAYLLLGENVVLRCNGEDGRIEGEAALPAFDFFLTNRVTGTLILGTRDGIFLSYR